MSSALFLLSRIRQRIACLASLDKQLRSLKTLVVSQSGTAPFSTISSFADAAASAKSQGGAQQKRINLAGWTSSSEEEFLNAAREQLLLSKALASQQKLKSQAVQSQQKVQVRKSAIDAAPEGDAVMSAEKEDQDQDFDEEPEQEKEDTMGDIESEGDADDACDDDASLEWSWYSKHASYFVATLQVHYYFAWRQSTLLYANCWRCSSCDWLF